MNSAAHSRVQQCYDDLLQAAGSPACSAIFAAAEEQLPFSVRVNRAPARTISSCASSGRAVTDFAKGIHTVTLAEELPQTASTHTFAHELFHLLHHIPSRESIEEATDYYGTFPEAEGLPRTVLRYIVAQSLATMYRGRTDTVWEQEAEDFAELVVTRAYARTLPASQSPLFIALGAPDARG